MSERLGLARSGKPLRGERRPAMTAGLPPDDLPPRAQPSCEMSIRSVV
jgi:hypothetical protein